MKSRYALTQIKNRYQTVNIGNNNLPLAVLKDDDTYGVIYVPYIFVNLEDIYESKEWKRKILIESRKEKLKKLFE